MPFPDFEEFVASLNANEVRYLVIGGHAVAFHARPRATKDLDVYIEPSNANAERTLKAIREFFGGADIGLAAKDLLGPNSVVQLGVAPVRIDLISSVAGVPDFQRAWKKRVSARFGKVPAHYMSLDDLILAKAASGRHQDKADLESLRRAKARE